MGYAVPNGDGQRASFLIAACGLVIPLAATLLATMGTRLRMSQLQSTFRFLAVWFTICCTGYCAVFLFSAILEFLSVETEILACALIDMGLIVISSLVITCAGPDVEVGLLPAQEAELSLYPGPHRHGFFPNLDYYDDNL